MQPRFGRRLPRRRTDDTATLVDLEKVTTGKHALVGRARGDGQPEGPFGDDGAEVAARPEHPVARVESASDRRELAGYTAEARRGPACGSQSAGPPLRGADAH